MKNKILEILQNEKRLKIHGSLYHKVQIDLTFNSNHIEGSRLSYDQTRYIFETNTLGVSRDETVRVDDILETANHFRCVDFIIENAQNPLSHEMLKTLHAMLKTGTSLSRNDWFAVGDYKHLPNEVGGQETAKPENVEREIEILLSKYYRKATKTLDDILDFHFQFEKIHPFQDGNGRVGRLVMFKECLAWGVVPFIITDELRFFYYRGLREWQNLPGFLRDTCLSAQDDFKRVLDYFRIDY